MLNTSLDKKKWPSKIRSMPFTKLQINSPQHSGHLKRSTGEWKKNSTTFHNQTTKLEQMNMLKQERKQTPSWVTKELKWKLSKLNIKKHMQRSIS